MVWHSECLLEIARVKKRGDSVRPFRKREGGGMGSSLQFHSNQFKPIEDDTYATTDDFQSYSQEI